MDDINNDKINQMIKDYNNGMSFEKISLAHNISIHYVRKYIRDKVDLRNYTEACRQFSINENYFDNIDREIKAYYLGLFYADGYNREDRNTLVLSLQEDDGYIIKNLFNELDYGRPLIYKQRSENRKPTVIGEITNKHLSEVFSKYGCCQNKTFTLTYPEWLNKDLYSHFIRGYLDGDGSIVIPKTGFNNISVKIAGTYELLDWIQEILCDNCGIDKNKITKINKTFLLQIGGSEKVNKVLDYIYNDANIYFNRKYDKYIQLQEYNNSKHNTLKIRKTYTNNSSGVTGVHWDRRINKWVARITHNNKNVLLGNCDTFEEAVEKRIFAESMLKEVVANG